MNTQTNTQSNVVVNNKTNYGTTANSNIWFKSLSDQGQSFLDKYLSEIKKFRPLKKEQLIDLVKKAQTGDIVARNIITEHNLLLVIFWAKKYESRLAQIRAITVLDLIQEGGFGLIRAIETYDPNLGAFSTYATEWIHNKIKRCFDDLGCVVRRPVSICSDLRKYEKVKNELFKKFSREPNNDELSQAMEMSVNKVVLLKDLYLQSFTYSLDAPVYGDENEKRTLSDVIAGYENDGPEKINDDVLKKTISHAFKQLCTPKQFEIVTMRFGLNANNPEPRTRKEVGEKIGVSYERIRQIEMKILGKIALLPNFVRIGLAIGLRISPEVVREAKERQKKAQEIKKLETIAELDKFYKLQANPSIIKTLSAIKILPLSQFTEKSKTPHVAETIQVIADFYNVSEILIYKPTRKEEIVRARFVVIYILKNFFNMSYSEIGRELGGRDHTTIMHGYNQIEKLLTDDNVFIEEFKKIRNVFNV